MDIEYIGKTLLIKLNGKKVLAVGDLHLGYEESMNRSGILVSREMFNEIKKDFDCVFGKVGRVDEVVLLGDVKHIFGGIAKQEWEDVLGVIDYLSERSEKTIIVKGNHDAILEPILGKRKFIELKDYYVACEFCFLHGNKEYGGMFGKEIKYWVMGHGHPAVSISEPRGAKVEKYKCFLVGKFKGKNIIIVPSFFVGNIGSDAREFDLGFPWDFKFKNFNVKVVGESLEVLDFGNLGKLK